MLLKNAVVAARACVALSLTALLAMTAGAVDGTYTIPTGGGVVAVTNADDVTWLGDDLLIKFTVDSTSTLAPGSFTLPGLSQVRILAIGGGGGGGGAYRRNSSVGYNNYYGGGGGGGAGGFVETNGFYSAATYNVVVGDGGAGGRIGTTHGSSVNYNGESGKTTTIKTNGVEMISAYGGGGGGGESYGLSVAYEGDLPAGSGGGGSAYGTTQADIRTGGTGTKGQGNSGGDGELELFGGGGGGAGGAGTSTGTDKATANPVGGIGKASDITGSEEWYAGGGGGGHSDKSITGETEGIAGGKGGGGKGGEGRVTKPTPGEPCTGGGGGGAHANMSSLDGGAAGGSGVVYIRISIAIDGNIEKPDESVEKTYNGKEQQSVVESFAYTITGDYIATNAGVYTATVTLKDGFKWPDGTKNPVTVTMTINKAVVTIDSLWQKSWMYGTPEEAVPKPRCVTNFPDEALIEYTYGPDTGPEGEYDDPNVPVAVGDYRVRAKVLDSDNLIGGAVANAAFSIIGGLGKQFSDYVEITIEPRTGTPLTNFPYKVTLSEASLCGFLYSRAGKTGEDMAFTDASGNVLPYAVYDWNQFGESVVYVSVPLIDSEPKTIFLYWRLRAGEEAPKHDPAKVWSGQWKTPEEADAALPPGWSHELVVRDGFMVEYWAVAPKMTKTVWDASDAVKGKLDPVGTLADGAAFHYTILNAQTGETLAELPQTDIGSYRIVFELDEPGNYEPFPYVIDFCITGDRPFDNLKRGESSLTLNGRVMLANDDYGGGIPEHHWVTDQSYWQTNVVDGVTNEVFWTHEGEHFASMTYLPNLRKFPGSEHALCQSTDGTTTNVIWRFYDVILGNTWRSESESSAIKNFLPWSTTQRPISSKTGAVGSKTESGNIVLRNIEGAVVYSPCYTNGIGTIYFDAVNGWNNIFDEDTGRCNYEFVVELATETIDGKPPTDENAYGANLYGNDTWDGRLRDESWKPCLALPLKRDGTPGFVPCDKTYTNSLDISNAGTSSNFYRFCVNVDCRTPCRFRIRRLTRDIHETEDGYALILLDNIVVSYPRAEVRAEPYGWYDYDKAGKAVLGHEAAMTVPFPKIGDTEVYGRAKVSGDASAITNADVSTFLLLARMHYRWRYLNQQIGAWKPVDLSPVEGFVSPEPLSLPEDAGDVEFFYECFTDLPYYTYHDYSGLGLGLGGHYSESQKTVTNTWQNTSADAPEVAASGGVDWFFRLRGGGSLWEKASVVVNGRATDMELIGDSLWRGLVRVRDLGELGELPFYFEFYNKQTAGATSFASNVAQWYPERSVEELPGRGVAASTYAGGAKVLVDDVSGYIEFQVSDRNGVFSVGHAEYQTFNGWHDAKNDWFVGNSVQTSGVSSVDMMQTNANMRSWNLTQFTNSNWNLPFYLANYIDENFPKGEQFISHLMPGNTAWTGDLGQFVDASLTASNVKAKVESSGIAWQMRGKSLGKVTYDRSTGPSGIDTVTFKARLGQSIDFNDFAVWEGDGSRATNNYTFVFPAVMSIANGNDYSPGAAMSVVGYYRANKGCYEFRVERRGNDGLQLSIYKWAASGGEMTCECIASQWYSGATFQHGNATANTDYTTGVSPTKIPNLFGMFISLGEDNGATTIIAGLGSAKEKASASFNGSAYRMICCIDSTDTRLKSGSVGALTTNCKGIFMKPSLWSSRVALASPITSKETPQAVRAVYPLFKYYTNPGSTTKVTFVGSDGSLNDSLNDDEWDLTLGRASLATNRLSNVSFYYGITPPSDLSQTVGVYLKPRGGDKDWEKYEDKTVSSYGWTSYSVTVRTNENVSLQLRAGPKSTDVSVWEITQTGWNGENHDRISQLDRDFVYTQAVVFEKVTDGPNSTKVTNRCARLQPSRAVATRPLSIRGPLLTNGVGMVGFKYENADGACDVLVQVATNGVLDHLSGSGNYNDSLLEVELGEDEPFGYWITVTNYTASTLGTSGLREYYFGWHNTVDAPVQGVMRILVRPSVVEAAHGVVKTKPEYGAITITDVWVHDEPPLDNTSWIGWNMRTIGGSGDAGGPMYDAEGRMYLPDISPGYSYGEAGTGLSAGLNNSTDKDIDGDSSKYKSTNPTIQSPTFLGQTSIGQVRFRARLYTTNEVKTAEEKTAKVFLYGATDGAGSDWRPITNFTIRSTTYIEQTFSAIGDRYRAIRLAVDGVISPSDVNPTPQRVLLDEVVVSEKVAASVAFAYARPFRSYLSDDVVVPDILERDEQPLAEESWGVQAKLRLDEFDTDIDVDRGFKVTFRYFVGKTPWGFSNWASEAGASKEVELKQVGEPTDYVFRSTVARPNTVVPAQKPSADGKGTVVQYVVTAKYYLKGSDVQQSDPIAWGVADGWWNPEWYEPLDLNAIAGGAFSPYTILETVAPGRAWINEVNYNDGSANMNSPTNQFIEIAIPRGVDMTGWKVVMTDMNHASLTLATLGMSGRPAVKTAFGVPSGDYDLYVLQSPASRDAGGIRDAITGELAADGTWDDGSLYSTFRSGTLLYDEPYQFELVRPNGIVEHQFTMGGTNEWWGAPYEVYAPAYDGTNLLAELNFEDPSRKRFYAGDDLDRKAAGTVFSSFGVAGSAHGEEGGWNSDMGFTPGRVNEGQDDLSGWYVRPNGGSCWVYAQVFGDGISQAIGGDTSPDTFVVVNQGGSTNIEYTLAQWYQMEALTVNGETNSAAAGKKGTYVLNLSNVTGTTYVVAHGGISSELTDIPGGLGLDVDDPYTPAVMRWLVNGSASGSFVKPGGPLSLAKWQGLHSSTVTNLSVKEMYWLDIDPTEGGWWLRGGTVDFKGSPVYRKRRLNDYLTMYYTNRQIRVKLYLSNDVSKVVYAPYRLQGLGGEQSDDATFTSAWTSETFKVEAYLNNGRANNKGFMPFRWFVFGPNSFEPKGSSEGEYTSLIEILDPFSPSSPGYSYGWSEFGGASIFFRWRLNEEREAMSVEMLDRKSTYDHPPYEDWTP